MRTYGYILIVFGTMLIMVSWKNIDWAINQSGIYVGSTLISSYPFIVTRQWLYETLWFNLIIGVVALGSGIIKGNRFLIILGLLFSFLSFYNFHASLINVDLGKLPDQNLGWGLNLLSSTKPVITLTFPDFLLFHEALMLVGEAFIILGAYLIHRP